MKSWQIHSDLIETHGGSHGVRDKGLLDSAPETPKASFGGSYLHSDIYDMSAAYMYHIIKNHPFVDGNKRTGTAVGFYFLELKGIEDKFSTEYIVELGVLIAISQLSKENLATQLRNLIVN